MDLIQNCVLCVGLCPLLSLCTHEVGRVGNAISTGNVRECEVM